ncbi:MAG TPA: hypothetical protein VFH64_07465 [Amnibacterium sp.]|nr:hypothetical protein [Amnibacterium sp.]
MPPVSRRRPPNRRRHTSSPQPSGRRAEPEFEQVLEQLLADPTPLAFLEHASGVAEVLADPTEGTRDPVQFLRVIEHADSPAVRALAATLSVLAPQLVDRPIRAFSPRWLARIADTRATRAIAMTDVGGDSDQIVVEVRLADGSLFTCFALVDHDLGTAIADAFPLPADLDAVLERWNELVEPGVTVGELALPDAGARLREALENTAMLFDPPTSDTWPQSRPLLQWIVRLLPGGGAGWPRVEWTDSDLARTAKTIAKGARPKIGPDAEDVVETLLHYAGTHGPGDPLRWSARATSLFLTWLPGHVHADAQWYSQVPDALRAVIRYAHAERGLPASGTDEALEVVRDWELFQAEERLADLRRRIADRLPESALDPEARLDRLADEVGGDDALDELTVDPIPETAADLSAVPADVVSKLTEVIAILEPVIEDFFDDPELRLAATSLLIRAAEADPALFRRSSNSRMTAAAATWTVAKVNDAFGSRRIGDLMLAFGLNGSASQRANALLRALDLDWFGPHRSHLGDAALLTSRRRTAIVRARDEALAKLDVGDAAPFPTSITTPDGRTIDVVHQPGLAGRMLEELKPLLAADGIDLDDPDNPPDMATLQAGFARAVERRNVELFTPLGSRRAAALDLLRDFTRAVEAGDDDAALRILDRAQPESPNERIPEVSAVIGAALGLLDEWLSGRAAEVPRDLGAGLMVPKHWRKTARPAAEILALGTRDRAAESLDALLRRQGGREVLAGAALGVALAAGAWARRTETPLESLLPRILR